MSRHGRCSAPAAHLKVIRRDLVVLFYRLAEDHDRVSDEKMGDMVGEEFIDSMVEETTFDVFVEWHVVVIVLWSVGRIGREVAVDAVVPRFRDDPAVLLQWLPCRDDWSDRVT